jgi:hypothetical protein
LYFQQLTFESLETPQELFSSCTRVKVKKQKVPRPDSIYKSTKIKVKITRPSLRKGLRNRKVTDHIAEFQLHIAPENRILVEIKINDPKCKVCIRKPQGKQEQGTVPLNTEITPQTIEQQE